MASLSSAISSISSPTLSTSSYDLADSIRSRSSTVSTQSFSFVGDSDDEIVWAVSSEYHSSSSSSTESSINEDDDEFVVLTQPHSPRGISTPLPTSHLNHLTSALSNLCVDDVSIESNAQPTTEESFKQSSRRRRKRVAAAKVIAPAPVKQASKTKPRRKRGKKEIGLGDRPIVDDISEGVQSESAPSESSVYDEAVNYITSFLSDPSTHDRLTFMQSLIIELGIADSMMPASMTAAKTLLKSHAFLNIREYLAVRSQGPEAIQQVMYPSRSALIRSIRKEPRSRAPRNWVKDHGLSVLLVSCFH